MPTGPRAFRDRLDPVLLSGPGDPPDDFVRATTSGSEWILFWAFRVVMEPGFDPRKPPFNGTQDPSKMVYQYFYDQGRRMLGGSVVDFVVFPYAGYNSKLVRLQTERFHAFVEATKHAYDQLQQQRLGEYGEVYDVWEQWILDDQGGPPGRAAIMAVKDCLSGVEEINPLLTGQARRVRV